jgi:ubiquinone/menaquinone biosynthesis C-methylase UbiE
VQYARDTVRDITDAIRGTRDEMVPPRRQQSVGHGDYRSIGEEFRRHLVEVGQLQPHDRVLDVGCGSGRIALALLDYLDVNGSYEGFDVNRNGIEWATRTITSRNSRFRFQVADVHNDHYNKAGSVEASMYRFPYEDATFDLAFAVSLFTHMRSADVRNYLAEVARVLRPGGRALLTFYLLNELSRAAIASETADLSFTYGQGLERFEYKTRLAEGVAYEESDVREWVASAGLSVSEPIHYGSWTRSQESITFQDIVLATAA